MAEISKITTLDGTTYDIKDTVARSVHEPIPIATKSYTDIIGTANENRYASFFYLKVRPNTSIATSWHVKTRVIVTVPGYADYYNNSIFDIFGYNSTYSWYACLNNLRSTSYRPFYYNSVFFTNATGYNNNCGHWIGINLTSSTNQIDTNYKRAITVELLAYDGCTVEFADSMYTPDDIPNRSAHTGWYSSTNTSFSNFSAASAGLVQSGDANTTSISNLYHGNGNFTADSALYRYQLLFQKDDDTLTPLNNVNNSTGTSKTMLTNVEFDPFGQILYYSSTTAVSAGAAISAGALFFAYSGVDLRYTFNCGTTLTSLKPLYLIVTPLANGKCKIANTMPLTHTLPSTNDGKWYIYLGRTYSAYQVAFYPNHPIYYHDGTKLCEVLPQKAVATSLAAGLLSSTDKIKLDHFTITKSTVNDEDVYDIEFI